MKIQDAKQFGKVAVLMGGWAAERAVSLKSGAAVCDGLRRKGVDATAIDAQKSVVEKLQREGYERAFIALHGRGGEDGVIQGALELAGIPYTGSGVLASALGMDKLRTKRIWQGGGIATPPSTILTEKSDVSAIVEELGLPLIVKPAHEGSSIGMSKINNVDELLSAHTEASRYDREVFVEKWIGGAEYTVAILGDEALPPIRLETPHTFYDYSAKYEQNTTRYHCPCGLGTEHEQALREIALAAFQAVGARGWGRVDVMADEAGNFWPIEINTVPGMTDHSLVPMAAKAAGIEFDELVWRILETSMDGDVH